MKCPLCGEDIQALEYHAEEKETGFVGWDTTENRLIFKGHSFDDDIEFWCVKCDKSVFKSAGEAEAFLSGKPVDEPDNSAFYERHFG